MVRVRSVRRAAGVVAVFTILLVGCENPVGEAVRSITQRTFVPEIQVRVQSEEIAIAGTCQFGSVFIGQEKDIVFEVTNLGKSPLVLSGSQTVTCVGNPDFALPSRPPATISPQGTENFTVRFTPALLGLRQATLTIISNDTDEETYTLTVEGTGTDPAAPEVGGVADGSFYNSDVTPTWSAPSGVSYTATISFNGGAAQLCSSGTPLSAEGTYVLVVTATVAGGNQAPTTIGFTIDKTAPTGSLQINSGASYTGSQAVTLTLAASDGAGSGVSHMLLSNASDFSGGSWEPFSTPRAWTLNAGNGLKSVYGKLRDKAGNEKTDLVGSITLDASAPAKPGTPDLAAGDDSGVSSSDNITSTTTGLTFTGAGAEPGCTVLLIDNSSTTLGTATADGSGNWLLDVPLGAGGHSLRATVRDAALNESSPSDPLSVTVDTSAPGGIPSILRPFQGENTGSNKRPTFTWAAAAGADYYEMQADNNSNFASLELSQQWVSGTSFTPGANMAASAAAPVGTRYYLRVRAVDTAGNVGSWSNAGVNRYVNVGRFDADFNGDGYSDVAIGATETDTSSGTNGGRVSIHYGGSPMDTFVDVFVDGPEADDSYGYAISGGDLNADGYCDLIVGAYRKNVGANADAGSVYIYHGPVVTLSAANVVLTGEAASDYFGASVACAGDVNADGYADVLVGAYQNDTGGTNNGKAYLYYGGAPMNTGADKTIAAPSGGWFGRSVAAAGDVNNDSYCDLLIGAEYAGTTGMSYVYLGAVNMDTVADVSLTGEAGGMTVNGLFGNSCAGVGDVNGDGYGDVAVGAWALDIGINPQCGKAYVFYGGPSMNSAADVVMAAQAGGDHFGICVSGAGDVNRDGYADVIIGARDWDIDQSSGRDAGRAYIYMGSAAMDNSADVVLTALAGGDQFGEFLSGAGDVNADGYADVAVGAAWRDNSTIVNCGEGYVFFGGSPMNDVRDVSFLQSGAGANFGRGVY